jgi:hypothetical protein
VTDAMVLGVIPGNRILIGRGTPGEPTRTQRCERPVPSRRSGSRTQVVKTEVITRTRLRLPRTRPRPMALVTGDTGGAMTDAKEDE